MNFGDSSSFAIEVDNLSYMGTRRYVQFRFWICGRAVGDWDDQIPLAASVSWAKAFLSHKMRRVIPQLGELSAQEVFREIYTDYYEREMHEVFGDQGSYREWFHLDDIGMSSIVDKYGLILVAYDNLTAHLLWKCWRNEDAVNDCELPFGFAEDAITQYIAWGEEKYSV